MDRGKVRAKSTKKYPSKPIIKSEIRNTDTKATHDIVSDDRKFSKKNPSKLRKKSEIREIKQTDTNSTHLPDVRSSKTTQTLKNKAIKPLVDLFDNESLSPRKSNFKHKGSRANMKNLGRRFITLVKKNALENKNSQMKSQDNDLHLIKEKVSVRQIKRAFTHKSESVHKFGERNLIAKKVLLPIKQGKESNMNGNSSFLNEFLESVKKKSNSLRNTKVLDALNNGLHNEDKIPDSSGGQKIHQEESTNPKQLPLIQETVTACHMFTVDNKQKKYKELSHPPPEELFQPKLYTFRMHADNPMTNCPISTKPPPFWALLDNFIAVIWALLKQDSIGINQLQWTYELLKMMKYKNGLTPDIIEEFTEAIQDKLIYGYAEYYNIKDMCRNENSSKAQIEHRGKKINLIALKCIKKNKWVDSTALSKSYSLREIVKYGPNSIGRPNEADQMIIKSLIPTATTRVCHSKSQVSHDEIPEGSHPDPCCLTEKQKEELKHILTKMRKEQAERVKNEIGKIHKIETLMGKVDNNFNPNDIDVALKTAAKLKKLEESTQIDNGKDG
ncbi:hypothetical protein M8J75_008889 [Diaphorina citri]|nr:hypothetical protein M8J75_008889 [Diaphorina citri]